MVFWQVPSFKRLQARPPVILIGMHRSGTSLLSQLLGLCDVHLGHDLDNNFESAHMRGINKHAFTTIKADWNAPEPVIAAMQTPDFMAAEQAYYQAHMFTGFGGMMYWGRSQWLALQRGAELPRWGWKDPRTSITLPAWLALFPDAHVIHIIRNGIDVAISLHRRQIAKSKRWRLHPDHRDPRGHDFRFCFSLWETYQAHLLTYRDTIPAGQYTELHYETLLQEPASTLISVLDRIGVDVSTEQIAAAASTVNPERLDNRRRAASYDDVIPALADNALMRDLGYTNYSE
ncbi:MAG: sulfotransferase [Anaerolineae bacterium]|nr:sulfotransferase [Anaerolineae bacterium]